MLRTICLLAIFLPAGSTCLLAGEPISVKLTVQDRLGVPRTNEPVTSGVPLPKGAVKDANELSLWDAAGKPVAAQFAVANRWWDDGSIKWVHVDFQATVPANGSAVYTLKQGSPVNNFKPSPLVAKQSDTGVEVNTGPLKFTVSSKGIALFGSAELNGKPILAHEGGIVIKTPDGLSVPTNNGGRKVTIEEQGPMRIVVLLAGRHVPVTRAGQAAPADIHGLDYKIRIYACVNSPLVKVAYTIENRRGKWADHVDIADWNISFGIANGDGKPTYRFGLADKPVSAAFDGDQADTARMDVVATDAYQCYEVHSPEAIWPKEKGNPHKENPPWLGAVDLSSSAGGVTVMVRNFWQLWAKYLEVSRLGAMGIGLWTNHVRDKGLTTMVDKDGNLQVYAGVARTHEMWFNFHGPLDEKAGGDPNAIFYPVAAAREPLFARCEPSWYCQGTRVFGDLSEADPAVYQDAFRPGIEKLNKWAEGSVKTPLKRWQTVKAGPNGEIDSYGLMNYGDGVEEQNDGKTWDRIHWEGGYYDYPHSIYLQFARTADPFYLWLATDMSQHNAEIHHTHHDTEGGRSRYCPSWGHIIMDSEKAPYASGTFNHWKNGSAFDRWYLTGDHRAREAALEITGYAMRLGNSGIDWGQPRSICHGLYGFWNGYDATGDKKYLDQMAKFAKAVAARIDKGQKLGSGGWQRGMALQGLCWYVEQTGDESVMPAIKTALERDFKDGSGELAYACVFLWKRTGEAKYFEKAVQYLGGHVDIWMQRFGNNGRSKLFVPTIVRKDAPRAAPK